MVIVGWAPWAIDGMITYWINFVVMFFVVVYCFEKKREEVRLFAQDEDEDDCNACESDAGEAEEGWVDAQQW